jgi:hypothetical protein
MFGQMKIKTRILAFWPCWRAATCCCWRWCRFRLPPRTAGCRRYLPSLFPAALKMQEAEASFERMKKHYGDAVVLQDANSLNGAERCRGYCRRAGCGERPLAPSPELGKQADDLLASSPRSARAITTPMRPFWPPPAAQR